MVKKFYKDCEVEGYCNLDASGEVDMQVPIRCFDSSDPMAFIDEVKLVESRAFRLLTGEKVLLKKCCMVFDVQWDDARKMGFMLDDSRQLELFSKYLLKNLLRREYVPAVIDGRASAKLFIEPDSWKNVMTEAEALKDLSQPYHLEFECDAYAQIDCPVALKSIDFFKGGFFYKDSAGLREKYEIAFSIAKFRGNLLRDEERNFFMLKPENYADEIQMMVRRSVEKKLNFSDFISLIFFAHDHFWGWNWLSWFDLDAKHRNADFEERLKLDKLLRTKDVDHYLFEVIVPSSLGSYSGIRLFLMNLYYREISKWKGPLWVALMERVWLKISMDPVLYCDSDAPLVADFARLIVMG